MVSPRHINLEHQQKNFNQVMLGLVDSDHFFSCAIFMTGTDKSLLNVFENC